MVKEKKLVDDVSGWLKIYDDGSVNRTLPAPEVKFMAEPVPPSVDFVDGVATRDVVIDPASSLAVRVYLPEQKLGEAAQLPVLLHFHGGGFCISQPDWYMYHNFYSRLVRSARAACVSVYLRRAPEHRLPAQCEDGLAALQWLRSLACGDQAVPWLAARADFSRVFLIGDSSGGNLVHAVAALAGEEPDWEPLRLAGGIPLHPGFVRAERSRSELELKPDSPFLTLDMMDKFLAMALPVGATKDHPLTCPMGAAAPPLAELNLPPILMVVAENDLVRDTELEYVEAMKAAGKEVEVLINAGVGHSFYLNKIAMDQDPHTAAQAEVLIGSISDFMQRHGKI